MKNKTVHSIGEFGLIEMIKHKFGAINSSKNIIAGIGDDCFCFKTDRNTIICITKDMLIENVHFKKNWISAKELGQKAIEVNVSDIAAMGNVKPKYIFIGLGIPPATSEKFIRDLTSGFETACKKYKMTVGGGDTVKDDKITISITAIGITKEKIIKRSGAGPGDLIGVTNTFGSAGAAIALLYKYGIRHKYSKEELSFIHKQNNPSARIKEAEKIAKYLTSMTDASDGLYTSVELLANASNLGADVYIDQIPLPDSFAKIFKDTEKQLDFALFGGEDYELVFTVPKSKSTAIQKLTPNITYIGRMNSSKEVKYFYNGKKQKVKYKGFRHF
ncbi:MAG: thiamine-phosphate kinase [Endomicrobium sp.]|jgi:thiamine-monophosphate kinase|nr:thiamine-phosphate kinase [Endomicrobium sp.]